MNRSVARCVWVVALGTSSVRAQPAPEAPAAATAPTLTWTAPAPCPSSETISREVEQLLRQPLSTPYPQAMQVDAVVSKAEDGLYQVHIVALTEQGTSVRSMRDADCTRLGEASALVIALAIDPTLATTHDKGAASATPADGGSCPPCPAAARTRSAEPPRQSPAHSAPQGTPEPTVASWSVRVAAECQAGMRLLDKPAAGLGLSAEMAYREQFALGLAGHTWGPQSIPVPGESGASVGLRLTSVGLRACLLGDLATLGVSACAGPELGDLQASGRAIRDKRTEHALWSALMASLGAAFPLTRRLTWRNRAEAGLALARPRVGVSDPSDEGEPWRLVTRPGQLFGVFVVSLGLDLG